MQDLEAEGLNPFLLTYIANSLFMVYLPVYALAKRFASHGLKGRQATAWSILPWSGRGISMPRMPCLLSGSRLHSVLAIRLRYHYTWLARNLHELLTASSEP